MTPALPSGSTPLFDDSADYRPLHAYLSGRFADSIVLTFGQIEDLLGHTLPGRAYTESGWWTSAEAGTTESLQSSAWIRAQRTATVNLAARTVLFDRA